MKALVLAGGIGSRLRPITHTFAKQLLPIANKPVLFYGLESIRDAGIREVGIVVGDTTAKEIEAAVGDGSEFGLEVTYIFQQEPRGLAHAVIISRDYLGDDDFVMYLGDNFVVGGISDFVDRFRREGPQAQVMLTKVTDPQAFGVAELGEDGAIVGVEEKPQHPKGDLVLIGVYAFDSTVHQAVLDIEPSRRNELEITDAIQWLIDHGHRVDPMVTSGYWRDAGSVHDILAVNRFVLEGIEPAVAGEVDAVSELIGHVVVEEGAVVADSKIVGPVVLGAGSVVRGSFVGPFTSIDRDCVVIDSEIEHSIVLRGAHIESVARLEQSLIGRKTRVVATQDVSKTHRFILGDHNNVQVGR
ncbi:glucose-1-phosphate thymidylyltransferase [Spongiactinospora sp. TRM90649]|uniref:glucose-1-phosphate thymidylyltransferase n=1 Tax=Spongiactinospora sp. TRM90649 TaxID=3031114 RepID=UPI0023F63738|nr:glucose-1-phosphate thymidylyltransferase [Spongiactinospora sp. TRM90649]MDF5753485.1 glucose-1-phosphate thymidylyltransferase [Spongiactinospora sp. TRM90649]